MVSSNTVYNHALNWQWHSNMATQTGNNPESITDSIEIPTANLGFRPWHRRQAGKKSPNCPMIHFRLSVVVVSTGERDGHSLQACCWQTISHQALSC